MQKIKKIKRNIRKVNDIKDRETEKWLVKTK